MTIDHSKCDETKLRYALNVKYIPGFEGFIWKNECKYFINFYIDSMFSVMLKSTGLSRASNGSFTHV